MKRIMTLLLAAGLVFGASSAAKAVDIKASGYWQFGWHWGNNSFAKDNHGDTLTALQRFRTQIDIIASESLKGVVFFEIGKTHWGKGRGGSLGSDGYDVKVRYSYVDWVVPQTDLKVRMGIQPFLTPNFVAGGYVIDDDGAGITLSYDFTQNVGATLFWLRAENDNNDFTGDRGTHDALDFVGLTLPIKGDGFRVTPWGMWGSVGRNSLNTFADGGNSSADLRHYMLPVGGIAQLAPTSRRQLDDRGNAWWVGLGGELTLFSPFRMALDAAYGSVDMGSINGVTLGDSTTAHSYDMKRAGWMVTALAEYKLDFMTPGLIFWYGSGDDDDPYNGSERMPSLNPGWAATPFGFDGGTFNGYDKVSKSPAGTWGLGMRFKDITFVENLKHLFQVSYYRGTNDSGMPKAAGMVSPVSAYVDGEDGTTDYTYMTKDDWAVEVNLNSQYKIYEDLTMYLDLGYIRMDIDENNWKWGGVNHADHMTKNLYRVGVFMRYDF